MLTRKGGARPPSPLAVVLQKVVAIRDNIFIQRICLEYTILLLNGSIAQLVEHRAFNPQVPSSILGGPTTNNEGGMT
jgi:hypothetical protein